MHYSTSLTVLCLLLPLSHSLPLDRSDISRRSAQDDSREPIPVLELEGDSDLGIFDILPDIPTLLGLGEPTTTVTIDKRFIGTPTTVRQDGQLISERTAEKQRITQDEPPPSPSSSVWPAPPEIPDDNPSPFSRRSPQDPPQDPPGEHPEGGHFSGVSLLNRRAAQGGQVSVPDEIVALAAAFERTKYLKGRAAQGEPDEKDPSPPVRRSAHGPDEGDEMPPMPPMPSMPPMQRRYAQDPPPGDEGSSSLLPLVRRAAQEPGESDPTPTPTPDDFIEAKRTETVSHGTDEPNGEDSNTGDGDPDSAGA